MVQRCPPSVDPPSVAPPSLPNSSFAIGLFPDDPLRPYWVDTRVGRIFDAVEVDFRPPMDFEVAVFMRRPVSGFCPDFFDEYAMTFLVGSAETTGG
jgi:hypothetical protein